MPNTSESRLERPQSIKPRSDAAKYYCESCTLVERVEKYGGRNCFFPPGSHVMRQQRGRWAIWRNDDREGPAHTAIVGWEGCGSLAPGRLVSSLVVTEARRVIHSRSERTGRFENGFHHCRTKVSCFEKISALFLFSSLCSPVASRFTQLKSIRHCLPRPKTITRHTWTPPHHPIQSP